MAQETITIYRCDRCGRRTSEEHVMHWFEGGTLGVAGWHAVTIDENIILAHPYTDTCYRCTKVIYSAAAKLAPRQEKNDVCNNEVGID